MKEKHDKVATQTARKVHTKGMGRRRDKQQGDNQDGMHDHERNEKIQWRRRKRQTCNG